MAENRREARPRGASAQAIGGARLVACLAVTLLALQLAAPRAGAADLSRVFDAGLGGDMAAALAILDSIPAAQLTPKDSATAGCIRRTFQSPPTSEGLPARSGAILAAYRNYWQSAISDARGDDVKERPVYPADLLGSMYALMGIDATAPLPHPLGLDVRVMPAATDGLSMGGLLKEIM
ncbi:MAG TPA: hypothetical protein VLT84_07160 [Acidobacteriota bacterium]|nr:hypothetical protein [Acidobacteriota bacterium]